jgi:oligopeptidase B
MKRLVALRLVSLSAGLLSLGSSPAPTPPVAPRKDHAQVWHGRTFVDPYYWLREKGSPDVVAYLEAENAYTEATTADLQPFSKALYEELLGRIKQTDLGVPSREGRFYYYRRTVEGQQYPIRCRKPAGPDGALAESAPEEVLLDQNEMSKGLAFLSVGEFEVSDDAARLLYSTDTTGFRQYRLFVKDLETGSVEGPLAERVTSATWAADDATAFYVTEHPVTKRPDTLWRLKIGGRPEKVYEEQDELFSIGVGRTKDKKFVVLASRSTDTWDRWLLPASAPGAQLRLLLPREKGHKYDIEHREGTLFIRTNKNARNFRLVTAPLADPSPARWKPLVEHRTDVLLDDFEVFRDYVVVQEKQAALNRLRIRAFSDGLWKEVSFPEPVYSAFASGTPQFDSTALRYSYQSLTTPPSVYDYDMARGTSVLLKREEVLGGFDPGRYASERLWATARDGVKVPISIVYPKGLARDGKTPLWLYAYGSYGAGMSANFDSRRLSLLDRGIPFAIAHIRGGNEMGEAWHDDGMLMKKKNTFFDFIDCAQFLVAEKWTSPDRLLIEGGSAGGLLMGAVTNERPDLFRAVHAAVPFVDVMNTYNDSQVMYWEPAKYVAKLRTLKTDSLPLVLRTKMQPAGHGGASGRYDALKDRAFELAWMLRQVGITK